MTGLALKVLRAGPAVTVQDPGRPGWMSHGLSRGGAADQLALAEGAALLGQQIGAAALEMGGMGGVFEATGPIRIALTGAPMSATVDGVAVPWNASHGLAKGARLEIGGVRAGVYGYLHVGGGFDLPEVLGARSAHLAGGIGAAVSADMELPIGRDPGGPVGMSLPPSDRFSGGTLRLMEGIQTDRFDPDVLARLQATTFSRSARGSRQGIALEAEGPGFVASGQLDGVSETIVPGDVQMTGEGLPYILLSECQTIGGYPRVGTVLPCDMPLAAQVPVGAAVRFRFLNRAEAEQAEAASAQQRRNLARIVAPLHRDPREMSDLLSYQLISGVVSALDEEFPE